MGNHPHRRRLDHERMAENKKPAAESAAQKDAPAEAVATDAPSSTAMPASQPADTRPRFGRGILIGAAAAALVTGVALGGVGGFTLAHSVERGPALAQQGGMPGGPMQGQQGPGGGQGGQGGPGGGQQGGQQGGPQGPNQQGGPQGQNQQGPHHPGQNQQNDDPQNDDQPDDDQSTQQGDTEG
jgi:hypothetical protein